MVKEIREIRAIQDTKWARVGVYPEERNRIYEKNRVKAYTILKNQYKKKYEKILNGFMFEAYERILCENRKPIKELRNKYKKGNVKGKIK